MDSNKIIIGDNIKVMKDMPSECIDLTVTSPPYDDLRKYKGYSFNFEETAKELYRITKDGGVVVWIVSDGTIKGSESGTSFKQALYFKDIGFRLHDTMIWHKPNAFNFGSNLCYKQAFEYMFVFSKGKPNAINLIRDVPCKTAGKRREGVTKDKNGVRNENSFFICPEFKKRDNVWGVNVGGNNHGHPAVFPEKLAEDHILSWSNEGDLVFDPFVGSGTTVKMAKINGRNYIGIDCSEEYVKIAKERLK